MNLIGSRSQQRIDDFYQVAGTITAGNTPQLLLPQRKSTSALYVFNNSSALLTLQIGIRPAVATLNGTTGTINTSITVNDVGFGFNYPPTVLFLGGGNSNDPTMQTVSGSLPDWPAPSNPAQGYATISSGTISAITVTNVGSGYLSAPYVFVQADRRDPTGVGVPTATVGIPLPVSPNGSIQINGTFAPTSAIAIFGGTTGQQFTALWAP